MASNAAFIGIDLAWKSDRNHTGAVALHGDEQGAALRSVSGPIRSMEAIRQFIDSHSTGDATVIAIDAPLIIRNTAGQRPCETAIGRRYGRREASCHTSNLRLYPSALSVALAADLVAQNYVHAPAASEETCKLLLEVYPHAALVALFDLPKTLKYKKGRLSQKRAGLELLASHIRRLSEATPPLYVSANLERLLSSDVGEMSGLMLKMHEDTLDAVICAYLGYYFWRWRGSRNEIFGDLDSGYIINPMLLVGGIDSHPPPATTR